MKWLLSLLLFVAIERFCYWQTDGFRLYKILSSEEASAYISKTSPEQEALITSLLQQPFHYLGRGTQCFCFVSDDGEYVLKLVKHFQGFAYFFKKSTSLQSTFESFILADQHLKEECALLYVHLGKSSHLPNSLRLIDKSKVLHTLNPNQLEFVLQKRVTTAHEALTELLRRGNEIQAHHLINAILETMVQGYRVGIRDMDPEVFRNYGFHNGKAIHIDIGCFHSARSLVDSERLRQERLLWETFRFRRYLHEKHPALLPYLDARLIDLFTKGTDTKL